MKKILAYVKQSEQPFRLIYSFELCSRLNYFINANGFTHMKDKYNTTKKIIER